MKMKYFCCPLSVGLILVSSTAVSEAQFPVYFVTQVHGDSLASLGYAEPSANEIDTVAKSQVDTLNFLWRNRRFTNVLFVEGWSTEKIFNQQRLPRLNAWNKAMVESFRRFNYPLALEELRPEQRTLLFDKGADEVALNLGFVREVRGTENPNAIQFREAIQKLEELHSQGIDVSDKSKVEFWEKRVVQERDRMALEQISDFIRATHPSSDLVKILLLFGKRHNFTMRSDFPLIDLRTIDPSNCAAILE